MTGIAKTAGKAAVVSIVVLATIVGFGALIVSQTPRMERRR